MLSNCERERRALASCVSLRDEVQRLQAELVDACAAASAEEANTDGLAEQRAALLSKEEAHAAALQALHDERAQLAEELKRLQTVAAAALQPSASLLHESSRRDAASALGESLAAARGVADLRQALDALAAEHAAKEEAARAEEPRLAAAQTTVRDHTSAVERARREKTALRDKLATLERVAAERGATLRQLTSENEQAAAELKSTEDAIRQRQAAARKSERLRAAALAKLAQTEQQKADAERQRAELALELETLEESVHQTQKAADAELHHTQDLRRELDAITKSQARTMTAAQRQADALHLAETSKRLLQTEISGLRSQAAEFTFHITNLQAELDACTAQASQAAQERVSALDDVRAGERAIAELQRVLSDSQETMTKIERRYESIRSDRNKQGQAAIEAHKAVEDSALALDVLSQQSSRIKDDIAAMDELVLGQFLERSNFKREHDAARAELKRAQARVEEVQSSVEKQKAEITRLQAVIAEGEAELKRQDAAHDAVLNERDLLSVQLSARTTALRENYELLKTHHSALVTSERRLREAQKETRALSLKLADALHELETRRLQFVVLDALKRELLVLGRELLAEQAKRAAIAGVMTLNMHRFRAGDTAAAWQEAQGTTQELQCALSQISADITAQTEQIQQEEATRRKLESQLARREATGEALSHLQACRTRLRSKVQELHSLTVELAALRAAYKRQKANHR